MTKQLDHLSKFLSLILRHKPEQIGLQLDDQGWAEISVLIQQAQHANVVLTKSLLHEIVTNNKKQRFALSADGLRIRANQGHSLSIELNLMAQVPPDVLLHGTATRFLDAIRATGLSKMQRHHVHLTTDSDIAQTVGARYGKAVVLSVDAKTMHEQGAQFFCSANGVWLVDSVAPEFIN